MLTDSAEPPFVGGWKLLRSRSDCARALRKCLRPSRRFALHALSHIEQVDDAAAGIGEQTKEILTELCFWRDEMGKPWEVKVV